MNRKPLDNSDFYYNDAGFTVLTEKFLLERGFCCGNGCLHCPYEYANVPEPLKSELIEKRKLNSAVR